MNNLIILPVIINDSVHVNLILDTGCRNLVLFGKRFQKLFNILPSAKVVFSGLGAGEPLQGSLSLDNKVSINAVLGNKIPVVIVPNQNLFSSYPKIDGVIGYDIFTKFEIELNVKEKLITFRPATHATLPDDFVHVPIRIEDSKPLIDCEVVFSAQHTHLCNLMIDTGSTLSILLKTTDMEKYPGKDKSTVLGRGLNGDIEGMIMRTKKIKLAALEIENVQTAITHSPWHNYASLGMSVLKDYSLILNYCKSYAGFKKH